MSDFLATGKCNFAWVLIFSQKVSTRNVAVCMVFGLHKCQESTRLKYHESLYLLADTRVQLYIVLPRKPAAR